MSKKGTFTATFTVTQEESHLTRDAEERAEDMRSEIVKQLCWRSGRISVTVDSATFTPDPEPRYTVEPVISGLCRVVDGRYNSNVTGGIGERQAEAVAKALNELEAGS